jgi:SAM-dependent methyltransferase
MITSIRTNSEFLVRTFRSLASNHPRVLVSGTADYGMLAHLHHAYGQSTLDATVVDLCATPLFLNDWYANRTGRVVRTVQHDMLGFASEAPFDLIATHNFLGRFDATARRRLVTRWHRLLRPGGVVVTTQRVRPGARQAFTSYSAEEAAALGLGAEQSALRAGLAPPLARELHDWVRDYALAKISAVIQSTAQITDVLEACGFSVDLVDEGGGVSERHRDRPSSTAGRDTFRMRIIARRTGTALDCVDGGPRFDGG